MKPLPLQVLGSSVLWGLEFEEGFVRVDRVSQCFCMFFEASRRALMGFV